MIHHILVVPLIGVPLWCLATVLYTVGTVIARAGQRLYDKADSILNKRLLLLFLVIAPGSLAQKVQTTSCVETPENSCFTVGRSIGEHVELVRFKDRQVPRLRYAIELRDELRTMRRLCDHPEDWDKTVRAIADGAQLIEMAVCHHDKKSRRTMYRVKASWLQVREYPSASVVEGVERRPSKQQ